MNPELNCEYPEPGEAKLIVEMVRLAVERMEPRQGHMRRGQHAKATGCVRGVFTIRDDVADDLRYGVFSKPNQSFQAIVRFSNSSETIDPDGRLATRGMAIKLLDVEGTPAIPATGSPCQDFLTVNHPVFPFGTPAEYVKFFDIRAKPRVVSELVAGTWLALFHRRSRKIVRGLLSEIILPAAPVAGDLLAAAWLALFHPRHATIATEILLEVVASPLVTYWSGSPYWLGPSGTTGGHAVKYSLVPRFEATAPPQRSQGQAR